MNRLVDDIRKSYDTDRSDSEILTEFVEKGRPWVEQYYPEAIADYEKLKSAPSQPVQELALAPSDPEPPGVGGYLKQAAGSVIRGASEGLASTVEGIATFGKGVKDSLPEPARKVAEAAEWALGPSVTSEGKIVPMVSDENMRSIGKMLRNAGEIAAPDLVPELEKSWLATKIPKGVGSAGSFMAGGIGAKLLRIPAWLGVAGFGAASTGQGFFDDAISKGADERTAFIASLVGNIVGTSEAVPLAGIIGRIDKITGGSFTKELIKNGVKESFEEAVQNSAQQIAQNFTAQQLYEKDRELFEGAGEAAGVGGSVGFVVSTLASALGLKLGKKGGDSDERQVKGQKEELLKQAGGPGGGGGGTPSPSGTPGPVVGTDISDVAQTYELTPEEITRAKEQRAAMIAAHPELAEPPAATPEQAAVEVAAAKTDPEPTPAEKKSGKYEKGQVVLDTGITVDIENAAGSTRTGKDKDGEEWAVVMPAVYGEVLGVKGKDKDWLDIFLGPDVTQPNVFVVNQIDPKTKKLDEQKIFYGFNDVFAVEDTYYAAFSDGSGPKRKGSIVKFTKQEFQDWLENGDKNKPAENVVAEASIPFGISSADFAPVSVPKKLGATDLEQKNPLGLRAAARTPDGNVVIGGAGDLHMNLPSVPEGSEFGFATKNGAFLTRDQASEMQLSALSQGNVNPTEKPSAPLVMGQPWRLPAVTTTAPAAVPAVPSPNAAAISEAIAATAETPVAPQAPAPVTAPAQEQSAFDPNELVALIDWPTVEGEGKASSQVAKTTAGKGVQSAMAFEDTGKLSEAVKDATVPGKKLGFFMAADGSHGFISAINNSDPRNTRVSTQSGGMNIERFLKSGYKLVGSSKLKVPLAGFNIRVAPADFKSSIEALKDRGEQAFQEVKEGLAPIETAAVVAVQPDEIIEDFTRDEAKYLWNAIGHLKPEEIVSNLPRVDGDARYALKKILGAFMDAGLDEDDAVANTIIYVEDAKRVSGNNQQSFIESLFSEVGKIAESFTEEGTKQADQATATAEPAGSQTGGAPKEGGQGAGAGTQQGAEGVRFRGGQSLADWRIATPEIRSRMLAAFEGLEASGISVTAVGEELNGQVQDMGGYVNPAARSIVIYMSDQHAPNRGNLITVFHEAGDFVLSQESPERQMMFHQAINSLSNEAMGIVDFEPKLSPLLTSSEANVIRDHERLSESVARKLEQQGFNPAEARGIWNAVVRWMRDVWYRVAMAIQKARFGEEHVNPETAEAYFTNRLMSLLAGDTGNYSFVSWLGGPKPTGGQVADVHTKSHGLDELGQRFDPDTGEMVYEEVYEDSSSAVKFNNLIRYQGRKLSKVTDEQVETGREPNQNYTAQAQPYIAAQNEKKAISRSAYDAWTQAGYNSSGVTFEQWIESGNFISMEDTDKLIALQQEGLAAVGAQPADETIRMAQVPPHEQARVANSAYKAWLDEQGRMEVRLKSEAEMVNPKNPANLNSKLQRNVARLNGVVTRFEDLDYLGEVSLDISNEMMNESNRDAKDIQQAVRKHGALTQAIKELEGRMDEKLAKDYSGALQRNYKRWKSPDTTSSRKFSDTLRAVAELGNLEDGIINWSADGPIVIRQKILDAARTTPELSHLLEPSLDRRAEMAILIAFGKSHFEMVTFLSMQRRAKSDEKAAVAEAVKLAMGTHRSAIKEAKAAAAKAKRYAFQAGRLVDEIARMKAENRSLLDEIVRIESFAEFYTTAKGVIQSGLNELGRVIGAQSEDWEAHANATALIPRTPNEPEGQWEKVTLKLKENGTINSEVTGWIKRITERLDSKPQDSWTVAERTLDTIRRKLTYQAMNSFFPPMRANLVTRMIGSITDKLQSSGHPAAIAAAGMIRRIDAFSHFGKREQETLGPAWAGLEGELMDEAKRILKQGFDLQSFRDLVFNPMGKYFENRGDFWASTADKALAKKNATAALRLHFDASPQTAKLAADPKFWRVMEKFVDQTEKNIDFLISAGKSMGRKIEDMGYFRDIIGATLNYMPRKWRRTTEKMWQEMQPSWDGTKDERLDGSWVAGEYVNDPATLKAKVAARLTPSLWQSFVRQIVESTGRSSFYSPQDGPVRTLAIRGNLSQALEATTPLDLVGFAENLYKIESTSLPGQPLVAVEDYVAEVLGTFQNFYQVLHSEFAGKADSVGHGLPRPNGVMMDARISNEAPSGWLEYMPMDGQTMRLAIRSMAFQFGGGRNLDAIRMNFNSAKNDLSLLDDEYNALRNKLRAQGLTGSSLRKAMMLEAEAKGGKGHLVRMEQASSNARLIGSMSRQFDSMVKMQLDIPMELRTWIELIGTIAGMTVQGPATALSDLSYMFIQPFRNMGLTKEAFEMAAGHARTVAEGIAGTMGWAVGKQLNLDSDLNQVFHDMGWDDSDASLSLKSKLTELTHEQLFLTDPDGRPVVSGASLHIQRGIKLASRGIRQLMGTGFTGFQKADTTQFAYPTLKIFSPFTMTSQLQHLATAKQMWKFTTPRIVRAMRHFDANPSDFNDPAFRFKAKDLGMSQQAFDYINAQMAGYGMSFETLARDAMNRRAIDPTAEILTPESYRNLGVLGTTETVMESGMTTRMPSFLTNPWLAAASPLASWAVQSSNVLGKRVDPILQAEGAKATAKATWNMLLPYAAVLPIGIAFALFREWFDEHMMNKKANVRGFGQGNDFLAVMEKASRTSVFGMAGDVVNSLVNSDTNRPFSVDARVLFLSSIFGLGRATATWARQGFDYNSVGRPYMTALGGSGFLQQIDVINHALTSAGMQPLMEAEARTVAKINVQNYLRAGGRSLGMDVRTGTFGAQGGLPNPAKPFIGQMVMASYVNDPQGFADANRKAVVARMKAEGVTYDKAKEYVKRAYEGMHPLSVVFQTKPSEAEFMRLVAGLPDHGKIAVMTALRNYGYYGKLLGIEPSLGKKEEKPKSVNRQFRMQSLQEVRGRAMAY